MPLKIISDPAEAPIEPLKAGTVAVIGFGNQGSAHAMNLRDSGVHVLVANRPDSVNGRRAAANGFSVLSIEDAVAEADLTIVALPDEVQGQAWRRRIAPRLRAGTVVGFLHGFTIRYGIIDPPPDVGVVLVAPKGPGRTLRARFVEGRGIPCLFAPGRDGSTGTACPEAEAIGLAWAHGIGCARAAIVYTTFAEETETDLFGEQAVLCGGLAGLIVTAFETLVRAGYSPEIAYMECCQEVKQIADLIYERGLAATMAAISNTAEFGAYEAGGVLVDDTVRGRMEQLLEAIRGGRFAARLRDDFEEGFPRFEEHRARLREHAIEPAGQTVRTWLPWLADPESVTG